MLSSYSNRDSIFTKIANKIAEQLSEQISIPFVQTSIENVQIKTQDHEQQQMTFDLSFTMNSIKPHVEYIKRINGVEVANLESVFQIDADAQLINVGLRTESYNDSIDADATNNTHDTNIATNNNKKVIGLNKLIVHMSVSLEQLLNMPIVNYEENGDEKPIKLHERKYCKKNTNMQ